MRSHTTTPAALAAAKAIATEKAKKAAKIASGDVKTSSSKGGKSNG